MLFGLKSGTGSLGAIAKAGKTTAIPRKRGTGTTAGRDDRGAGRAATTPGAIGSGLGLGRASETPRPRRSWSQYKEEYHEPSQQPEALYKKEMSHLFWKLDIVFPFKKTCVVPSETRLLFL